MSKYVGVNEVQGKSHSRLAVGAANIMLGSHCFHWDGM